MNSLSPCLSVSTPYSSSVNPPHPHPFVFMTWNMTCGQVLRFVIQYLNVIWAAPVEHLIWPLPAPCKGSVCNLGWICFLPPFLNLSAYSVWVLCYLPAGLACSSAPHPTERSAFLWSGLCWSFELAWRRKLNDWAMLAWEESHSSNPLANVAENFCFHSPIHQWQSESLDISKQK